MKYILTIAVIAVIGIGAYLLFRSEPSNPLPSVSPSASLQPLPSAAAFSPTPTPSVGTTSTPRAYQIEIKGFKFMAPSPLTVARGDTIIFKNMDNAPHTVTTSAFDSGTITAGGSWTLVTASLAPGTYSYRCSLHPSMLGVVIVQ